MGLCSVMLRKLWVKSVFLWVDFRESGMVLCKVYKSGVGVDTCNSCVQDLCVRLNCKF